MIKITQDGDSANWTVEVTTAHAVSHYLLTLAVDEVQVHRTMPSGKSFAVVLPRREDEDDASAAKRATLIAAKVESML